MQQGPSHASWFRNRQLWLFLLAAVVGLRIALPSLLRVLIVRGTSSLLHTRVVLSDVDLSLLRGGIALENAVVFDPATLSEGAHATPLIAWRRLAVELHWMPLLQHVAELRNIEIDSPRIALTRLKDGALDLAALVPSSSPSAPAPTPTETTAPSSAAWRVGIDRIELRSGTLHFQDRLIDAAEPLDVALDQIEIVDIALQPGVYGEPSHIRVDVKIDESVIGVEARFELRDPGFFLDANIKAKHFPLRRARLYVPHVGWRELRGILDTNLEYHLETGVRDEVRGKLSLRDVTVQAATFDRPALAWKEFEVEINPLDLLHHSLTVPAVSLSGADVLLRLDGNSLLPALAPPPDEEQATPAASPPSQATAPPTPSPPVEWQWAVEALHLADSRVHLLTDPALDVALALDGEHLTSAGDQAVPVKLNAKIGDGSLRVDGGLRLKPLGISAEIKVDQFDLPTTLAALHVGPPGMIKSAKLDSALTAAVGSLAPTPGDVAVHGGLTLSALQLVAPGPDATGVGIDRLQLDLTDLNLTSVFGDEERSRDLSVRGKIDFTAVEFGLSNPPDTKAGIGSLQLQLNPLSLAGLGGKKAARGDLEWHGTLSLADVKVPNLKGAESSLRSLELAADPLQVSGLLVGQSSSQQPSDGDIQWRGSLTVTAPHFGNGAAGDSLDIATAALAGVDVKIDGAAVQNPLSKGNVGMQANLSAHDLRLMAKDPKAFSVMIGDIDVPLDDLKMPGLLSHSQSKESSQVQLGAIRIKAPIVRLTRNSAGIVMPSLGAPETPAAAAPAPAAPPTPPAASKDSAMALSVKSFGIERGSLAFSDRTTKPFFNIEISPLAVDAKALRFPNPRLESARVDAGLKPQGSLHMTGSLVDSGGTLDLKASDIGLTSFNPYARALSSYSIANGSVSATTKASTAGDDYKTDTEITLHDFDVAGSEGDSLFQQEFGIPLSVALALLRDLSGNIVLNVPAEITRQGTKVELLPIVQGSLRAAIVSALASPLKLAGTIFQGDKVVAFAQPTLAMRPGRAQLTTESGKQLDQLAALLASRPAMAVTIDATASSIDARWLREQGLLAELSRPQGLFGAIKNIGKGGMREAIQKALEERAKDGEGKLDGDQQQTLEQWLGERPEISAEQLQQLSRERLEVVRNSLSQSYGIEATRVDVVDAPSAVSDGEANVRVRLHPVGHPPPAVEPAPESGQGRTNGE